MGWNYFEIYFRIKRKVTNEDIHKLTDILKKFGAFYDIEQGYFDHNVNFHKGTVLEKDIDKVKLGYSAFSFKLNNIELQLVCQTNKDLISGFVMIEIPILTIFIKNYRKLEPILIGIVKEFLEAIEEVVYVHSGDHSYINVIMDAEEEKEIKEFVYASNNWISYFPKEYLDELKQVKDNVKKIQTKRGILFVDGSIKDHLLELK